MGCCGRNDKDDAVEMNNVGDEASDPGGKYGKSKKNLNFGR